ncbi:MAG: 16S rRNA (guanine(527)-N(7))-methyltransferase RsmG, partial [Catalinimonas sp.]
MDLILKYFPDLTESQRDRFAQLDALYRDWNAKINVVSRRDIDQLYLHHVLHSLAIGKYVELRPFTQVLDVGTGGGFPGVPLAILFPEARFHLVDSIGKKIKVVAAVAEALELKNVTWAHARAERVDDEYDFVVSRAVAPLETLWAWAGHRIV